MLLIAHLLHVLFSSNHGPALTSPLLLLEKYTACVLDPDTLDGIPTPAPAAYHVQKLAFAPSDRDDGSNGAGHPRLASECLLSNGRLNLAEIC